VRAYSVLGSMCMQCVSHPYMPDQNPNHRGPNRGTEGAGSKKREAPRPQQILIPSKCAAITTQDSAFTNTKAGVEPSIGACPEET
jgi:hypothetical protein